jgi:hypothetical protein
MAEIFISYASEDKDRAEAMARVLEEQGWSVWWDRRIPPGRDYAEVIESALREARCVVVLWTKSSVASKWVRNEVREGANREVLVPALLDEVEIPFEFRSLQAARLIGWRDRAQPPEMAELLASIAAILGRPPVEPAPAPNPFVAGLADTSQAVLAAGHNLSAAGKPLLKWTGIGFCWLVALGGVIEYSSDPYADESLLVVAIVFGVLGYWLLRRR